MIRLNIINRPKVRFMRFQIAVLISLILAIAAFTSVALATDPLKDDKDFLFVDYDKDGIVTWLEFKIGTNPLNSDTDNDGIPDGWEFDYSPHSGNKDYNALMDPTDSSDAHLDFDYEASLNLTIGRGGERACDPSQPGSDDKSASHRAILKLKNGQSVVWPSNPDMRFIDHAPGEDDGAPPHYDNYEEYFRPYTYIDSETNAESIKYMHTNPTKPDTDGDGWRDPDDWEPLSLSNDGTSPGGDDSHDVKPKPKVEEKVDVNNIEPPLKDILIDTTFSSNYDIIIDFSTDTSKQPTNYDKKKYFIDADNDGI